ncbi:CHAD domain-containing protein [Aldersonia sp. NBC_00410]|uniref:CHAD domain-containing protein n=1 Tax=Aldersonia sp. NBC_00410 TaxID=2975954 RepID=UPI002255150C|nr:CHAD domain-containing protein [Aldersonia sp. NBC_00410]MCX5042635.1 CHAD domain-containing protein [Aldersonia sp. NBC_00410]
MSAVSAGPVIVAAVGLDVDRLTTAEPAVRIDAPDSVHQMRVATRRLRSVLRSYRKVFARNEIDAIRSELRWLGEVLGVARDAEVRAARFTALLTEQPAELLPGPIATRLVTAQRARYESALADIHAAFDGERYITLRAMLDRLLAEPATGPAAGLPGTAVCVDALTADYERVRAFVRTEFAAAPEDRADALHDVRKAAKRLRYGAEAAGSVLGASAEPVAVEARALQVVLGDHRDAIESQIAILAAAEAARAAGEDLFGYGLLFMAEEQAARVSIAGYQPAIERLAVACTALGA